MMSFSTLSAALLALITFVGGAHGHSWMTTPTGWRTSQFACDPGQQCNFCPDHPFRGKQTVENPSQTWRRGQTVKLAWNKNNHGGGFVRFSLVPEKHMNSFDVHEKYTVKYGCWEQGKHGCRQGEDCGTDKTKSAFETTMTVPTVFPDGDYVLGYIWYGGLQNSLQPGLPGKGFADYMSCAHIKISGGQPVGGSFTAKFEPGKVVKNHIEDGKCPTTTDKIGVCRFGEGECARDKVQTVYTIPKVFKDGGLAAITPASLEADGIERTGERSASTGGGNTGGSNARSSNTGSVRNAGGGAKPPSCFPGCRRKFCRSNCNHWCYAKDKGKGGSCTRWCESVRVQECRRK